MAFTETGESLVVTLACGHSQSFKLKPGAPAQTKSDFLVQRWQKCKRCNLIDDGQRAAKVCEHAGLPTFTSGSENQKLFGNVIRAKALELKMLDDTDYAVTDPVFFIEGRKARGWLSTAEVAK